MNTKKIFFSFSVLLTLFLNPTFGIERIWTNVIGDDLWNEPLNWIPIGVPTAADSVLTSYSDDLIIPSGYAASIKYIKLLGELTIENTASLTINDGHFNCNGNLLNQGTITINNSPTYGLKHSSQQANSRPIDNEGEIYINNSALAGLWIRDDQTFTNETDAIVEITNSGEASIELQGTLSNRGVIRAQNAVDEIGLLMEDPESNFVIFECAKVVIRDKLVISDGLLSNFGIFEQSYNGDNDLDAPAFSYYFVNYGFLEDHHSSFVATDFDNYGVWIKSYEPQVLEGEPTHIFESVFPLEDSISNVYLEKELITLAGAYDFATNIWVPNSNAVGESTFFVEVSQGIGSCYEVVKFNLILPVRGVNYWLGGTGSWQFGFNWNFGTVPSALEKVGIYGESDVVNIPINYDAFAKDLVLKGKLNIATLSTLTIDNPSTERGIDMQEGELVNNGLIDLYNMTRGFYVNEARLENNGTINCSGTNFCIEMLGGSSNKSEFDNNINASVYSDSERMFYAYNSVITNHGLLDSRVTGIITSMSGDSLYNFGTINIKGFNPNEGKGILIDLWNASSGVINVSKVEEGFSATVQNYGIINIDSCSSCLKVAGGDFINKNGGVLNINQCELGIYPTLRDFTNEAGGRVSINRSELGILISSSSEMYNQGILEIDSSLTTAIHLYGNFYNELSGQVFIDRGTGNGLFIDASTADYFGRDQSKLEIKGFNGEEILMDKGKLTLEDNSTVRIKSN